MDDAGAMGLGKGVGDFTKPADNQRNGDGSLAIEAFAQGLAVDQGHHIVEERSVARPGKTGDLATVDEAENVGVLKLGGDADLAEEAVTAQRG